MIFVILHCGFLLIFVSYIVDFHCSLYLNLGIFNNLCLLHCGCALIFVSYIVDFYWSLFFKLWIFIDFGFLHCVFSLIFVSYIVGFHWSLFLTLWIFIDLCFLYCGFLLIAFSYKFKLWLNKGLIWFNLMYLKIAGHLKLYLAYICLQGRATPWKRPELTFFWF